MEYYIVSTDDEDADADDIITISNPRLNLIAEARIIDQEKIKIRGFDPSEAYEFRIVDNYNGKIVDIKQITRSKDAHNQALIFMLTKAYANRKVSINCDYSWAMAKAFDNSLILPRDYPYYLITDGGNVTMQSYNYFWDEDPKFQQAFRDNMGGNHQWELHWCNMGGRSGMADIIEVSTNAATTPILAYLWNAGGSSGDTYKGLYSFIKGNCRTKSPPEFSKRNDYIKERVNHHMDNDLESKDAFDYAVQDVRSLTKRQDPSIWYQEYENMGFDHPRPDYRDPKWKL